MTGTTTFVPTNDDDYSHFDEGSVEWKACRERDRLAAIALDEMFDAQKQGGEVWLAWVEKHRGAEARRELERKQRLCREEADRYWQWKDWISLQRELQEKEYCAIPAEEAYRQRCNDIWSGKYRGEEIENEQANEAADGTAPEPERLAESGESTQSLRNDSVIELPKPDLADPSPPVDDQSDKMAEPHQANEAGDDTVLASEKLSESNEQAESLPNDSVLQLPELDLPNSSPSLHDQSNEEFPSLTSTAATPKDRLEPPHPKSLYKPPSPPISVSPPPPTVTTLPSVETQTTRTRRHLLAASPTKAHRGSQDLASARTVVLKKSPAAKSPRAAKQQIKDIPTLDTTAQDDTPEKKQEKPVSTPKKQKKPTTATVATPAPVVVSGPISGRKRKVKNFAAAPAPQTPQLSVQASNAGVASAATPTCPALAPQAEAKETKVDISGAMEQPERVAAERDVAGEGSGERVVKFIALLLLLVLTFFLGYALGI
ncbi:hypothetical protein CKM354_001290000 [Cercospora kikuchii]|uniref:Uncharacterized protein n=1 Tax=Cercospora kikuchii TaxID=84275 RepID=A0A9P3FMV7_9PEZI|nr:uncharacterized protein CKM354_001290000 [Cercospora kikuchii]GIZ49883.1 hypothetical protein CKM354_001290000 [Cercospora kikuchii]